MVEVDEGVGGPELLLQLFASHDFTSAFQEQREDLKGWPCRRILTPLLRSSPARQVELEHSESRDPAVVLRSGMDDA